jgi:hypothetical protein
MWYFNPLACLYDLLQLGLGHLNGFVTIKELVGRETVDETGFVRNVDWGDDMVAVKFPGR